jgi:hypothetical protein
MPPPAEQGFNFIARNPRQVAASSPENGDSDSAVGCRRRKQLIELGLDGAHLLPAAANFLQQLRRIAADVFRCTPGLGDLVEQLLHPR